MHRIWYNVFAIKIPKVADTMSDLEPKKLALLRIMQILLDYSDVDHPLKQETIAYHLEKDYGTMLERKAVSRNLSLLKESGLEIEQTPNGSYLATRTFEDSELRLLIDSVLASKHISPKHSKELIEKLCSMSNKYFRRHVKNIYSVNDWDKTENPALFLNIEIIDEAIDSGKQIEFDYNKYGTDKKLHRTSHQYVTPYQFILHNQKYYLMSYNEKFGQMFNCRVDRITNVQIVEKPATDIHTIPGYKNGIDYKRFATAMPYMYTDEPQTVELKIKADILDQVIDWFGKDITISDADDENFYIVKVLSSPNAMALWAMQYSANVEVLSPASLRSRIAQTAKLANEKYNK